mmetsp:Transcript_50104/g.80857  ORF Transcript_50104/g.80857 Transcript_50104/m.80857 type:complete len:948 (+) Transcript_50104:1112-3955(+)
MQQGGKVTKGGHAASEQDSGLSGGYNNNGDGGGGGPCGGSSSQAPVASLSQSVAIQEAASCPSGGGGGGGRGGNPPSGYVSWKTALDASLKYKRAYDWTDIDIKVWVRSWGGNKFPVFENEGGVCGLTIINTTNIEEILSSLSILPVQRAKATSQIGFFKWHSKAEPDAIEFGFDPSKFFREGRDEIIRKMSAPGQQQLTLHTPQYESINRMRLYFTAVESSKTSTRTFMVIMPTGVGKTYVMALAPFAIGVKKVLIVLPGKVLAKQVTEGLTKYYGYQHPIGNTGIPNDNAKAKAKALDDKSPPTNQDHVITSYIQQLASASAVKQNVLDFLHDSVPKVDLVIVDEGHHSMADSWQCIQEEALKANPNCKFVLMTATPTRGDHQYYGLNDTDVVKAHYTYERANAIKENLVKTTYYKEVDISALGFDKLTTVNRNDERYIWMLLEPALKKLKHLRDHCGNEPIRMLVTVNSNKEAFKVAEMINTRQDWGGFWNKGSSPLAAFITGTGCGTKISDSSKLDNKKEDFLHNFQCGRKDVRRGDLIDVVVQCQMLGEGYDNQYIAISTFLSPCMSVGVFAQYHGRAIRKPYDWCKFTNGNPTTYAMAMQAYVYYPQGQGVSNQVQEVVKAYRDGVDESTLYLYDNTTRWRTLKRAHKELSEKSSTMSGITFLRTLTNFEDYHTLYKHVRETLDPLPAEEVAIMIYKNSIKDNKSINLKIIDFGCGRDGVFEHKLKELVSGRQGGNGSVETLAVDVVALDTEGLASASDDPIQFVCSTDATNYLNVDTPERCGKYDFGLFCLSFVFLDDFCPALCAAAKVLKFGGLLYIVLEINKASKGGSVLMSSITLDEFISIFEVICLTTETGFKMEEIFTNEGVPCKDPDHSKYIRHMPSIGDSPDFGYLLLTKVKDPDPKLKGMRTSLKDILKLIGKKTQESSCLCCNVGSKEAEE